MGITESSVAILRTYLKGDIERHQRLVDQLDSHAAKADYSLLLSAAFFKAVERRFAKNATDADVVEFVGAVRGRSERLHNSIDPRIAERLIRAVYTDEEIDDIDGKTAIGIELIMLAALVIDLGPDDSDLDQLLAEARSLADRSDT
jgi:hypothetical protein